MGEASRQTSRSLRLSEWLLLLLRCLLLALLAMLLAKPFLQRDMRGDKAGWIVVPKAQLSRAYTLYKTEIDSALQAGATIHDLATGFPVIDLADTTAATIETFKGSSWQLLKVLDHDHPDSFPVWLYLPNRLDAFTGERPQLRLNLHWRSLPTADTVSIQPFLAYRSNTDSVTLVSAVSKPGGNIFPRKSYASLPNDSIAVLDTGSMTVTVFADKYKADARYLQAALQAISQYTGRQILVTSCDDPIDIPRQQRAIFWLSDQPVDGSIDEALQADGLLFAYTGNKVIDSPAVIQVGNGTASMEGGLVYKSHPAESDTALADWTMGAGQPLLSQHLVDTHRHYRFYSRFNPAWNDMVWNGNLAQALLPLVFSAPKPGFNDMRSIAWQQQVIEHPKIASSTAGKSKPFSQQEDMSHWFWLAAFLVLVAERLLSWYKNKTVYV